MTLPPRSSEQMLSIYLALGQYPILSSRIRSRMRRELFTRGILNQRSFDQEVTEKAILSQKREGLNNPTVEETSEVWKFRHTAIRDQLTDYYFSRHLSFELFNRIVKEVLDERGVPAETTMLSFNPELSPLDMLFEQGMAIESVPEEERGNLAPRLQEIKVVLIRTLISDQLPYINIAKEWFTVGDLADIRHRMIGPGRIGGKAAGMLLARRILAEVAEEDLRNAIKIPESFFMGSDLLYSYMSANNLVHWNDQKYKTESQMRAEFPLIQKDFENGNFPPDILANLEVLLSKVGNHPLIVRSSSLLEDNFGTSFAGKYESIFCPNQLTLPENLHDLTRAIALIYASTLNPNALLYRRSRGLQDYDERMAILIQEVEGEKSDHYYFPHLAGVAFGHNLYRWAPQIRREDGFIRLVWGLGTRAVDRVGNDYPRLVALSHPLLRPSNTVKSIRRYSQQFVDVLDLNDNTFKTLSIYDVLQFRYPPLRYLAQLDQEGYISSIRTSAMEGSKQQLVLTFEDLLRRTSFAEYIRTMLKLLEQHYRAPVDMEFTAELSNIESGRASVKITIVQCRPQSHLREAEGVALPAGLPPEDVIFTSHFMIPQGHIPQIRYVLYVAHEAYFSLPSPEARFELERAIGRLNAALEGQTFICVGPGRWGTSNPDLGVHIDYGDIYNSKALVEVSGQDVGLPPEPSLGTHFFQDLLEAQIFPVALWLDEKEAVFNHAFFYDTPNSVDKWIPASESVKSCLRLIDVNDYREGCALDLTMDSDKSQGVAYLVPARQRV